MGHTVANSLSGLSAGHGKDGDRALVASVDSIKVSRFSLVLYTQESIDRLQSRHGSYFLKLLRRITAASFCAACLARGWAWL